MKNQFLGTLLAGIILIAGTIIILPIINRERAISDYAYRYGISKDTARILTDNGRKLDKPRIVELIERARRQ